MSRKARSNRLDLDYNILHRTGKKVPKVREPKMANAELQTQAINICSDIEDLQDSYIVEDLGEEDELNEYLTKLGDLKLNFRRIHTQLSVAEGENFTTKYGHLDGTLRDLSEKFKVANKKLNDIRKINKEVASKTDNSKFKAERKFFIDQVNWELDDCVWQKLYEFDGIRCMISAFESRLEHFYKICSDLYDKDHDIELGLNLEDEKFVSTLREKITSGKSRLAELKSEKDILLKNEEEKLAKEREMAEAERKAQIEKEEKAKIDDLMVCAKNLHFEIKTRYETFDNKCSVDVSKLSDYEVLDLKKREEHLHLEMRELIDKVSSFEKFVLPCGETAKTLRTDVIAMRSKCKEIMDTILLNIATAIKTRDISEKKLKNSAGLNIELQKFKGHNSDMDIYTFRAEFNKLKEPNVQKNLWADYLKKNCLAGAAYNLVSKIDNIEDIWKKLFEVYGDTQLMLQNKLSSLEKFSNLDKLKDDERIAYTISSLLNAMTDLSKLAEDYDLKGELYHGGGIHKIMDVMGKQRARKFIKYIAKSKVRNEEKWTKLIEFLKDELRERDAYVLDEKARKYMNSSRDEKDRDKSKSRDNEQNKEHKKSVYASQAESYVCHICDKNEDHVTSLDSNKKPYVEYIACKMFVEKTPRERDRLLFKKRLCSKCLKPGVKWNSEHVCSRKYACNQAYVKDGKNLKCEKHVLVCGFHCKEKSNIDLLEVYKKTVIITHGKFFDFTKGISISCFSESYNIDVDTEDSKEEDSSVYAFQRIDVAGLELNLFYDSGCGDLIVSKESADKLLQIGRAIETIPGPLILKGVNNQESICKHGAFEVKLPLKNGSDARMSGICVDEITVPFPMYPLNRVEKDIRDKVAKSNKKILSKLPKLPNEIGGKVDIMLGKQYLKYFPMEVTRLESGLTLYRSMFKSSDGSTGVVAGPHPEFSKIERTAHFANDKKYGYYSHVVKEYLDAISLRNIVPLLGYDNKDQTLQEALGVSCESDCVASTNFHVMSKFPGKIDNGCKFGDSFCCGIGLGSSAFVSKRGPKKWKRFEENEKNGINVSYRCVNCRNCAECKKGSLIEEISIQEEVEQDLINKSVQVDIKTKVSSAKLPFTADPDLRLVTNLKEARRVYDSQLRRLEKSPKDKEDIIEAENKLHEMGFVDYLDNLSEDDRKVIIDHIVNYYIPWLVVWSKSMTTPVRPVFNASQRTASGCSLNDILAKGSNNMNNLVQMILRWFIKLHAYHTDVRKMYNAVRLDKCHWRFHLYLWQEKLDPSIKPRVKFIKTIIYGTKSSGNQAERALRLTAELCKDIYPRAYRIVNDDVYVDDCISGEDTEEDRRLATDELKLSVENGGFALKGFTLSGHAPDVNLSKDGESISVGGLKWYPKDDYLMFNTSEINFARKSRGRKTDTITSVPNDLSMRNCVSIVSEIFDPTGRITPIIAGFKLDISNLHRCGLTWDEPIPDDLRKVWIENFGIIKELGKLKYKRAVVPHDAKSLDIMTIETGDASSNLICAATYARFEKKDGSFSCQLVFARSKVLPEDTTIPRAELAAACMNAATGYTVQKSFGKYHKKSIKLTDSMVALHWILSQKTTLKTWVRTRVIEINRLSDASTWRYVESANMIADIGTRKGATIAEVGPESKWNNGDIWMGKAEKEFPILSIEEIKLSQMDTEEANKEKVTVKSFHNAYHVRERIMIDKSVDDQIKLRYESSKYIIDPNRFRFRKIVRIIALVLTFIKGVSRKIPQIQESKIFHRALDNLPDILMHNGDRYIVTTGSNLCKAGKVVKITENMLKSAVFYLSLKASEEVRQFVDSRHYTNISKEIDGVLYYSGRILPDYQFDGYPELCEAAIDLCSTSFCVPVMDQYSPVAISIAMEIHWYHPDVKHIGIEVIMRQTERIAHIIGGRNLAISIKEGCKRCRVLNKRSIDVVMGPIQNVNLCIAPAFYATQVDIFGPFKSYSSANKRATIKVWFSIFCCCTTGAIDIRLMEDYSTDSFVQGYIRLSCRFGYPKYVLPDAGSQLVKGCENVNYSFTDIKEKLSSEYGAQFLACPVGAHYVHGKVERKIREVKKSVRINTENERLSVVQWETLMQQISNSINNLPIGLKNKTRNLENLDLITPNRLILGRNNQRCPNAPLVICNDHKQMIENNANIFRAWFKAWIINYVPQLIERSKWHKNKGEINEGDIVLFLKSEKEYDEQYQYGVICTTYKGTDGHVRRVDVEYMNHNEGVKRVTQRGVRDLVIVYPVNELDIFERLDILHE